MGDEPVGGDGGERLGAQGGADSRRGGGRQHGECGDYPDRGWHSYKRQHVVFAAEDGSKANFQSQVLSAGGSIFATGQAPPGGVEVTAVVADRAPAVRRYDPQHPDADKDGYVAYPDINPLTEMVDLMGATRAYGLNSSAVQAAKGMIASSLDILK